MKFINTKIKGVFLVKNNLYSDNRGSFQKLFQRSLYKEQGLDISIDEHFFSISQKAVIRGMHFQTPPFAQSKLVYVLKGKIIDVLLDLRRDSDTYLKHISIELSSIERKAIFIPEGIAHGFQSLEDDTVMVYSQSNEFASNADSGINPFSFGMEWPINDYVVSSKDLEITKLKDFNSPF